MRVRAFAVAAGAIACLLGAGSVALASTPSSGPVRMYFTYQTPTKDKVVVTGAIGDYGKAVSEDANGKVDPNGNFEKLTLKQGGFTVDVTAFSKAIQKQFSKERINPSNCSLALTGNGPGTIETGTGAYAGIGGKLRITLIIAGVAPKTKTGKCNLSNSAPFYGQYQGVSATGSVSFK
jgi:hypothetical protein